MKMKKFIKTFVGAVFAGLMTQGAVAATNGDIYDIRPCDVTGKSLAFPVCTLDNPMGSGDTIYFNVRLCARDKNLTGSRLNDFALQHVASLNDPDYDALYYPLKIGIIVSGELRFAELATMVQSTEYPDITDLVFSYKTQQGDFAMPIRFASTSGEPMDIDEKNPEYLFLNNTIWQIVYHKGDEEPTPAKFLFGTDFFSVKTPDIGRCCDYTLKTSGYYVKGVDFGGEMEDEAAGIWRSVPEGSLIRCPISSYGMAANHTTLYVWSLDESAVKIRGGFPVYLQIGVDGAGKPIYDDHPTQVARIDIQGGEKTDYFTLEGIKEGTEAQLALSAFTNKTWAKTTSEFLQDYVTAKVKTVAPLEPNINIYAPEENITVGNDPAVYSSELTVTATQSAKYNQPFKVTIEPIFKNPAITKWSDYVRINDQFVTGAWLSEEPVTLEFAAGEASKKFYLFALGADKYTTGAGNQLEFRVTKIEPEEAAAFFAKTYPAYVYLDPQQPKIEEPTAETVVKAVALAPRGLEIKIVDNYKNRADATGYEVYCKKSDTETDWTLIEGRYKPTSAGLLVSVEDGKSLPAIKYTEGTYKTSIKVVTPGGDVESDPVTFTVEVSPAASMKAEVRLDDGTYADTETFFEGTSVVVRVTINKALTEEVFAFLRPRDAKTRACVAGKNAPLTTMGDNSLGMSILPGEFVSSPGRFTITDGEEIDGTDLRFDLVLYRDENWTEDPDKPDEDRIVGGYQGKVLKLVSKNVQPTFKSICMNGAMYVYETGATMGKIVPVEVDTKFTVSVHEPSTNDLLAVGDQAMRLRWSVYEQESGIYDSGVYSGVPKDFVLTHQFKTEGKATIKMALMDKDMGQFDDDAFGEDFVFYVNVMKQPTVDVNCKFGTHYIENQINPDLTQMNLSIPEDVAVTEKLLVEVSVNPMNPSAENPGSLQLAGGGLTNKLDETGMPIENVYLTYIPANAHTSPTFFINSTKTDGTMQSQNLGFALRTKVLTETISPSYQKPWSEFFGEGVITLTIDNAAPTIRTTIGEENTQTNAYPVAQGGYTVTFNVGDVNLDVASGIYVEWSASDSDPVTEVITDTAAHKHTQVFKSPGIQTLTVRVYDKDNDVGPETTMTWYFDVSNSKKLFLLAHGPSGGRSTSGLSQRYANAAGLGEGHVFADDVFIEARNFQLSWNCGIKNSATVYGFGYKVNTPLDDGTLDSGHDKEIDKSGSNPEDGTVVTDFYDYSVKEKAKDSYFYCWIRSASAADAERSEIAVIAPERPEGGIASGSIPLASEQKEDESYDDTFAEAIFAKEYLTTDNMGDINQDGIPDAYVTKFKFEVIGEDGTATGNDLASLAAFNGDADFLPTFSGTQLIGISSLLTNSVVKGGQPFTADLEIRGWHKGLNDAPLTDLCGMLVTGFKPEKKYTDPEEDPDSTLSKLEYLAFIESGLSAEEWSPERPTDPTKLDTDGDGLSDGVEYFFWYRAHVGYMEGEDHKYMTGRRYNPANPGYPEVITSEMIKELYDPLVKMGDWAKRDTDNDGILDIQEVELGTNPLDFDTDGDGLPDGYELLIGTDPCKYATNGTTPDGYLNNDDDMMAWSQRLLNVVRIINPVDGGIGYLCATGEIELATSPIAGTKLTLADGSTYFHMGSVVTREVVIAGVARTILGESLASDSTFTLVGERLGEPCYLSRGLYVAAVDAAYEAPVATVISAGDASLGWKYGEMGEIVKGQDFTAEDIALMGLISLDEEASEQAVTLMHYHVYQDSEMGYDPCTAWANPLRNPHGVDMITPSVRDWWTTTYCNRDEFLVLSFFYNAGALTKDDITATEQRPLPQIWSDYTTDPNKMDTDGDTLPDGWELYLMAGPAGTEGLPGAAGPGLQRLGYYSPKFDFAGVPGMMRDPDQDGLEWPDEFSSIIASGVYATGEEIPLRRPEWLNKKFPTDPWNPDTDDDGLGDAEEGTVCVYGTGIASFQWNACDVGGGLNPCSVDTDFDCLPDGFEAQFVGTFGSKEVTDDTGSNTVVVTAWNDDGMDGTVDDAAKDYDFDGLNNYQEYMVGAMRCWRYDDTVSDWGNHSFTPAEIPPLGTPEWGEYWYARLVDVKNEMGKYNPHLADAHHDLGAGYFSLCRTKWDPNYNEEKPKWYMFKDGVYHDLARPTEELMANRFVDKAMELYSGTFDLFDDQGAPYCPQLYITCDPCNYDTDMDGMDDYYELFHGLNPLLGYPFDGVPAADGEPKARDIVFEAYVGENTATVPWSADNNYWYNEAFQLLDAEAKMPSLDPDQVNVWDFRAYPWLNGAITADPDGDNLRNAQEAMMANIQDHNAHLHTDPSPLWMTDSSSDQSLTYRYYWSHTPGWARGGTDWVDAEPIEVQTVDGTFEYDGKVYKFEDYGFIVNGSTAVMNENLAQYGLRGQLKFRDYFFSFEENEGYDSDHDYVSDFEEAQGRAHPASDAQDFDSPMRHQAMWFNGSDAFLQAPLSEREFQPTGDTAPSVQYPYLYFTVECWAKADAASLAKMELQTLVERPIWTCPAGNADEAYLRKTFLIGLKDGRWYTRFDSAGTDASQYEEIVDGPDATTDWAHIAASFDGEYLRLYVNGVLKSEKRTSLMPAIEWVVTPINEWGSGHPKDGRVGVNYFEYKAASMMVGASVTQKQGLAFDYAYLTRMRVFDEATFEGSTVLGPDTTLEHYGNFFTGYIDEVRVWDGARTSQEIANDYRDKVRYTYQMAKENREKVLELKLLGGTRQADTPVELPAELLHHWCFDHIPGGVVQADVQTVPHGFDTAKEVTDAKALWVRPEGWVSPWWDSVAVRSTVFNNTAWVPWVNDTVAHLPRVDGTTLDSFYWSENFAGSVPAIGYGLRSFDLPRHNELPSLWKQVRSQGGEPYTTLTRRSILEVNGLTDPVSLRLMSEACHSELRMDLLPMGGAYPKRISSAEGGMWDDGKAADPWEFSNADDDFNGLPKWWEEYAAANYGATLPLAWGTRVTVDGLEMTAGEAYLRDLANGMLPDTSYDLDYLQLTDKDGNGIADWWEDLYDLYDGEKDVLDLCRDSDGDGLSDRAEYLISEIYGLAKLDPRKPMSDGVCPDYFRKQGDYYLGEIFTDHDQVGDDWEALYAHWSSSGELYANNAVYDPEADLDGDGWTNYEEFRAGTNPERTATIGVEGEVKAEYPIPAIRANVTYKGGKAITAPVIFKAWSERDTNGRAMTRSPDAIWTCGSVYGHKNQGEVLVTENEQGEATQEQLAYTEHSYYVDRNPGRKQTYYLGPDQIVPGSVNFFFRDLEYRYTEIEDGQIVRDEPGTVGNSSWYSVVSDKNGLLVAKFLGGDGTSTEDEVVGSVDYGTGKLEIDFSAEILNTTWYLRMTNSFNQAASSNEESVVKRLSYDQISLARSYVKFDWKGVAVETTGQDTYYLGIPDVVSAASSSSGSSGSSSGASAGGETGDSSQYGHLRSGMNRFVVFADSVNANGEWDPGEPFGFVRCVDVGWNGGTFDVELTDTHPVFARLDLLSGNSDRNYFYGTESGNWTNLIAGELSGGTRERVRVVRTLINGYPTVNEVCSNKSALVVYNRVVLDKWMDLSVRSYLHEGDFLGDEQFDLDWDYFTDEVVNAPDVYGNGIDPCRVVYRLVLGNGSVDPVDTNNIFKVAVTREFDLDAYRTIPKGLNDIVAYNCRPTFRWSMGGHNSYTACQIKIFDGSAVVWDSGVMFAPKVDTSNYYTWTAPAIIGRQLSRHHDYTWKVCMYNAKFKPSSSTWGWSAAASLRTSVNAQEGVEMGDMGYSQIKVGVKYAGPVAVLSRAAMVGDPLGKVRLQAFTTADFSGEPVCDTFVTDNLTDFADTTPNATVFGLPVNGGYYLRAYIDMNGNGYRDSFESWGCTKEPVLLTSGLSKAPVVSLAIEDADTDHDWIPDAYEYAANGWKGTWDEAKGRLGGDVANGDNLRLKESVKAKLLASVAGSVMAPAGSSVTLLQNADVANLLLGLGEGEGAIDALQRTLEQKTIEPGSLRITSMTLDTLKGLVTLKVDATLSTTEAAALYLKLYEGADVPYARVNLKVAYRETMEDTWTVLKTFENVRIGLEDESVMVDVKSVLQNKSGFFKVDVCQ